MKLLSTTASRALQHSGESMDGASLGGGSDSGSARQSGGQPPLLGVRVGDACGQAVMERRPLLGRRSMSGAAVGRPAALQLA